MYFLSENIVNYTDQEKAIDYLIDTSKGKIFQLNETAKIIVNEIKDGKNEKEIVDKIILEFEDVNKQQVEADIHTYIKSLIDSGVVNVKDD